MIERGAGLLMYRIKDGHPEILLGHLGGPYFKNKDDGFWSIPKGLANDGEELLAAAKREFKEETGMDAVGEFAFIGTAKKPGKTVDFWSFEGDCDLASLVSNTCMVEWPPRTGKQIEIPEVDRYGFFTIEDAKVKAMRYQVPVIEMFETAILAS